MDWGVRYEPIAKQILEETLEAQIKDLGRIKHRTVPKIAASPDGLIISCKKDKNLVGRLVEIKCPYSRKIGGIVPEEYWMQMQIQLEVTNLSECEYVEVEIVSKTAKNMNPDLSGNAVEKGTMWLLEKDGIYKYAYSESEKEEGFKEEGFNEVESIEYNIVNVHNVLVKRDKKWYDSTQDVQTQFWNDVEKARANDFILPEPKYKRQKQCMIVEESV
jgi:hypothetical protein